MARPTSAVIDALVSAPRFVGQKRSGSGALLLRDAVALAHENGEAELGRGRGFGVTAAQPFQKRQSDEHAPEPA